MNTPDPSPLRTWSRRLLPWSISAAALVYVFGYAVDWHAIPEATAEADLPLFIAITVLDKIFFFLVWGVIQARVIQRFVEPVQVRRVLEVKAGAELLRSVNNSLADAAFGLGVSRLARGRWAAVVAVITIPFGCHFAVLLMQATLTGPLLEGGLSAHPGVVALLVFGWGLVAAALVSVRLGVWRRALASLGVGGGLTDVSLRSLVPFLVWFVSFAAADVLIQGAASRAFGVAIPWTALAAKLPILYLALTIPSLGNFGTREIAWAECFADYGPHEALVAFALWTNVIFLVMHVLIGIFFVGRALDLIRGVRGARASGRPVPEPLLHDAIDP